MRKLFLSSFAVLMSSAAHSADMPTVGTRPAVTSAVSTAMNWTGWYVGGNAGGVWSSGKFSIIPNQAGFPGGGSFSPAAAAAFVTALNRNEHDAGFIGGGQVGYLWQSGNLVLGAEADIQYTGISKTFAGIANGAAVTESYTSHWLNTDRVRVGISNGPALYYATGGLAVANVKLATTAVGGPASIVGSDSSTKAG
jgi:outer membrane immunogenic protein